MNNSETAFYVHWGGTNKKTMAMAVRRLHISTFVTDTQLNRYIATYLLRGLQTVTPQQQRPHPLPGPGV